MSLCCPRCGSRNVDEDVEMRVWTVIKHYDEAPSLPDVPDWGEVVRVVKYTCMDCTHSAPGDEDWSRSPAQIREDAMRDHTDMMNKENKMRMRHATNKLDEIYHRIGRG